MTTPLATPADLRLAAYNAHPDRQRHLVALAQHLEKAATDVELVDMLAKMIVFADTIFTGDQPMFLLGQDDVKRLVATLRPLITSTQTQGD